jgi:thiamine biosynthesis lipoprotein
MGTVLQLTLVAGDSAAGRAAADACFALGAELEAVLTTYDPASATSRMNASAGGGPFAAPPALARILADSQRLSRATGGVFDPTVGPLIGLWTPRADRPTAGAAAIARRGNRRDRAHRDRGEARRARAGVAVNSGHRQGWALIASELLAARGIARLSTRGSSWLALGAPADAPAWRVLLRDGRGGYAGAASLRDTSASFSESFGQWSEIAGRRYGHVIDPRTGWPIQQPLAGVAVAADGATAEALTKALLVLGPDEALARVAAIPGAEALVIDAAGALHESAGFAATGFEPSRPGCA